MLMGRSGLSPVMVGRGEELAVLRARVDQLPAEGGLPPVVVVSGEAGVGKTRLLRELITAVEDADPPVRVLAGHAEEAAESRPFGLLAEALADVGWDPLPEALAPRAHALGHVLAPLLPEHPPTTDHQHTADELLLAAVAAIRHEVGDGPAVVLFEDLHWADAESLALFSRLATTEGLPALLVGTLRPEDVDRRHPLARALPALERQRTVTHLRLGRLAGPDLRRMLEAALDAPVSPATVDVLHERTLGNPFFVEELVAAAPDLDPGALGGAPLPWNAAEAVLRRVDALEVRSREVLEAAAVLGSRVPFDRLAAVAELDEDELIAVLRDVVDRGLLREDEPDVFTFRHALTREAVASQLLGREQRRLHRAALAALDAELADRADGCAAAEVTALARHAAGAGDDERLASIALSWAERLRRESSARQAQALAELALDRCDRLTEAEATALHAVAAGAAWEAGSLEVALRHADRWHRGAVAGDEPVEESAALRATWRLRYELGDRAGADAALEAAHAVAERLGPSTETAWVLAARSQREMLEERRDEALAWADRALELAEQVDAPEVVPTVLVNKGTVLVETPGREAEGLDLLDRAKRAALERRDLPTALRALNNAVWHLIGFGDPAAARALLAELADLVERYGIEAYRGNLVAGTVQIALLDGDLQAARRAYVGLGHIEEPTVAGLAAGLGSLLDAEAEVDEAAAALAALPPLPDPDGPLGEEDAWAALARVALAARVGDDAAVADGLALIVAAAEHEESRTWLRAIGGEAVLRAVPSGAPDAALAAVLDAATRLPPGPRTPADDALHAHAAAALLARAGDHEGAVAGLREALELQTRPRPVTQRADLAVGLARSLAALGHRAEAATHAEAAVALLVRWPGWRRDEAEDLLRRLGGSSERGAGAAPGGSFADLTPREVEVLTLVAEGLSNREIGERLFITTKTAAVHVSNILAKVGAASRTEAAAWALRSGPLSPVEVSD